MEARVLPADLAPLERSVLHLRREGMRDWVAKDAKTDWRIDVAHCFPPIFEIGKRIPSCRMIFLHLIRIGRTTSRPTRVSFRAQLRDQPIKSLQHALFGHNFQHVIKARANAATAHRDTRWMNKISGLATELLSKIF
jgi:hypothetical protein